MPTPLKTVLTMNAVMIPTRAPSQCRRSPVDAGNFLAEPTAPARAGRPAARTFPRSAHTAATLLLEAGVHVKVVAARLGHAMPSLVMNTYGHATERMQKDATGAMELVLSS